MGDLYACDCSSLKAKKKLGRGSFGTVFLASDSSCSNVAVKVLHTYSKEDKRMVTREARHMIAAGKNPHVVGFYDFVDFKMHLVIIMEYLEFGSLKSFQGRLEDPLPLACKVAMIKQIANGINFLHSRKPAIIHRDVKLDNIFVDHGLQAKIGDFGLAIGRMSVRCSNNSAGTISHIAPELLLDKPSSSKEVTPGIKSDVYSFGITVWELITEETPYEYCQNDAHLQLHVQTGIKLNIPSDTDTFLAKIMTRAWHDDPDQRPTFQDLVNEIGKEFESNYEKDFNKGKSCVFEQIAKWKPDTSNQDNVCCKFPWEKPGLSDLPKSLVSVMPDVCNRPVPISEADAEQRLLNGEEMLRLLIGDTKNMQEQHPQQQPNNAAAIIDHWDSTDRSLPQRLTVAVQCQSKSTNESPAGQGVSTLLTIPPKDNAACSSVNSSTGKAKHTQEQTLSMPGKSVPRSDASDSVDAVGPPITKHPQQQPNNAAAVIDHCDSTDRSLPQRLTVAVQCQSKSTNESPAGQGVSTLLTIPPKDNAACSSVNSSTGKAKHTQEQTLSMPGKSVPRSDASDSVDAVGPPITNSSQQVDEKDLDRVSKHVGLSFPDLGRKLNLTKPEIETIEYRYHLHGPPEIAFHIMLKWLQKSYPNCSRATLARELWSLGLTEAAKAV